MSGKTYIGVNNIARNPKKIYAGVNGIAREVKSAYIGVNGIAKQIWSSSGGGGGGDLPTGYYPVRYVYCDSSSSYSILNIGSFTRNTRIICMCSSALSTTTSSYDVDILTGDSGTNFKFYFTSNSTGNVLVCKYGSYDSTSYVPDGETQNGDVPISKRYVIDINRDTSYGTYLRHGTGSYKLVFNNTTTSGPSGDSIRLNYYNNAPNGMGTKYYYIEIYENIWTSTSPVMQLYPCMYDDNGTMVAGLYDVVNQRFYGDAFWENGPRISNYDISL